MKRKKQSGGDEDDEVDIFESIPFKVDAPPPQPAACKRDGTGYINPNLPQPPFQVASVGPRKTGKSGLLWNLLRKNNTGTYGDAFKESNIIFYSPTKEFDKTVTMLKLKWAYGPPTSVAMIVDSVKSQQDSYRSREDMADVLLVLEDCTVVKDAWPVVENLGYTGRHFGINLIAVAHKITAMPRGVRSQLQQWMLFKPHEMQEQEWIIYLFSSLETKHLWQKALYRCWDTPYNFAYIDFERTGIHNIYRSGFNDPLFTVDEIKELEWILRNGSVSKGISNPNKRLPWETDAEDDESAAIKKTALDEIAGKIPHEVSCAREQPLQRGSKIINRKATTPVKSKERASSSGYSSTEEKEKDPQRKPRAKAKTPTKSSLAKSPKAKRKTPKKVKFI